MDGKVLLAVDGNSLVHRAFHTRSGVGFRCADGRPMWAVRGLVGQLLAAVDRVDPAVVVVGFDDPVCSRRRDTWPDYKAQRGEKARPLVEQLATAVTVVAELGVPVVVPSGLEADDVLAAAAGLARRNGFRSVLMTSDRDAFALIDETTSVLRIINGGVESSPLLTPQRLDLLLGIRPAQYPDFAALRGDPSDNLPGVRGIGPRTAARLLSALGSAAAVFDDVDAGAAVTATVVGPATVRALAAPAARRRWTSNLEVMAHRADIELGLQLADLRPLPVPAVRRVFELLELPATLPTALGVLSFHHEPGPAAARPARTRPEESTRRLADRHRQRFPPLRRRPAESGQLALFAL
jgi:DNA polymerase-1